MENKYADTGAKRLWLVTRLGLTNDRTKDGYGYKYAPLDMVVEKLKKPLEEAGLGYYFTFDGSFVYIHVIESETGANVLESGFPVIEAKNCQDLGKAITYGKRYLLKTVFNISEVDDPDDVDNANFNGTKPKKTNTLPKVEFFA